MKPGVYLDPEEIIVDCFAGGGGASLGIEEATGRAPDIAINHDAQAIAVHKANHPGSEHYQENIWRVDPVKACRGRRVGLLWASPDCTHHSKARGGKPRSKKLRGLAWVVTRWAKAVRPRVISLENVEEFQGWGPLLSNGTPCPKRKGKTFRAWRRRLERLGYVVEARELRACNYGSPTIRKRLFIIARCDGEPIRWPAPSHGKGTPNAWHTAAECIDWSIPCPSIFERRKPLVPNTCRRVARGVYRHVIHSARPFIVPVSHAGDSRVHSVDEPLRTITGSSRSTHAVVAPVLVPRYGERRGQEPRSRSVEQPLPTVVPTQNGAQLVAAFMTKHYTERPNGGRLSAGVDEPLPTVTARATQLNLTLATMVQLRGGEDSHLHGEDVNAPLRTISAGGLHAAEVRAFLVAYYGNEEGGDTLFDPMRTVVSKDRFGLVLVTISGQNYVMVDIGMRMLTPRELARCQGFPDSYLLAVMYEGKPLTKTAQVKMIGNSVCPQVAEAIVRANVGERVELEVAA